MSSPYIVSARKYRPSNFETVIGQPSTTNTLKSAIRTGQLAHAYLFCGPRGVGKTTCARIFAKTINCFNLTDAAEACDVCESCIGFNEGRSYNIHELDAASNNSVDDIRQLVDQVRIPPQIGKFSVYIIDEVHMLSTAAFNAFLKTLEEPPSYAIFILATTEKHKILPTIISRCQVFDFNRIGIQDTVDYLKHIAKSEGITYEDDALRVIANKADGGMRDALSIFDQVAVFSENQITYKNTVEDLNVLDYEHFFKIVDFSLKGELMANIVLLNKVLAQGFDGQQFIVGLGEHLRSLLVSKDKETLALLETSESVKKRYAKQAEEASLDFLIEGLTLCNECDQSYRQSKNKRLLVELTLIQLAQHDPKKKSPIGAEEN